MKRSKIQDEFSRKNKRDMGHEPGKICSYQDIDQNIKIEDILTEREQQIVMLVSVGLSNKQIAVQLKISEWTVSTHLRRVFTKLNVNNRTAMAYQCAELLHRK